MDKQKRIFVTGASGFIGRNLFSSLNQGGFFVRASTRGNARDILGADEYAQVGDINESTDWTQSLDGVDVVVHLAARVHIVKESESDALAIFRKINVDATERLASAAAASGVKRFIFLSSVKVNGEGASHAYTEEDVPTPQDAYGISKREAEDVLRKVASETGLEIVILRPPLVYGPGVKANFRSLIKIARAGLPLPLKNIHNQRSFIYVKNLVDVIFTCITHPKAVNQTFLVCDGEDVSTPDLIRMLALAAGKKPRLFSFPLGMLKVLAKIAGKSEELEKITGFLRVDSSKIRDMLGWKPPFTMEEGIRKSI